MIMEIKERKKQVVLERIYNVLEKLPVSLLKVPFTGLYLWLRFMKNPCDAKLIT